MEAKVEKSPNPKKKFRVQLINGKVIDFGAAGYSDYTIHKNPLRMRSYLIRHGGLPFIPKAVMMSKNKKFVENKLSMVSDTHLEKWKKNGVNTAGFWSRWLLWSKPSMQEAKKLIKNKFNIKVR